MNIFLSILLFIAGLVIVIYFAEQLVKGVVGTSLNFGISSFLISVIFIGFDPENLFVGAAGTVNDLPGIALGSIIGAAMVAVALAFGITVLFVPLKFKSVPIQIVWIPNAAIVLYAILGLDGILSRIDGAILELAFVLFIFYLIWQNRRGIDIKAQGEVAESLGKAGKLNKSKSVGILIISIIAITAGSEMLVEGSKTIISKLQLSDTVFGMTILAFLISIEEIARELPAAKKGKPDISFGNILGSILAFFLCNAGIISLIKPVSIGQKALWFYLPLCFFTVIVLSVFMLIRKIPRWAGGIFVGLYFVFLLMGYFI